MVDNLPEGDVGVNELGFNRGGLITVGMVFRTERVGEVESCIKIYAKLVVFGSVVERRNVVVRRDPNLLIEESRASVRIVEDVEILNFVRFLTEVIFNGRSVLLEINGGNEEKLSIRIFGGG